MKVIDLVVLDFNLKLKDKTVFKVLNQIGHDKYIYNRKDRKFYVFEYETENENISLVIDSKTIAWEIEIIEEDKPIEKMKLEVGMYYRDKWGRIGKILSCGGNLSLFDTKEEKDLWEYEEDKYINRGNIKKASFNIIDLIGVGDYVNGMKVTRVSGTRYDDNDLHCYCDENHNSDIEHKNVMVPAKDIKSIVTKEQFESSEYVVEYMLKQEIEIIEEDETIEKIVGLHHPSTKSLDLIKEDIELTFETIDKLIDKVNELERELKKDV